MQPHIIYKLRSCALLVAPILFGACTTVAHRSERNNPPSGKLITAAEIERVGARDVWDVLRWSRTHIQFSLDGSGRPLYAERRNRSDPL